MLSAAVAEPRCYAVFAAFAGFALSVAAFVICALLNYIVSHRRGEIGGPPDPSARNAVTSWPSSCGRGPASARRVHSSARWCPPPRAASSRLSWSALAPTIG